MKRTMIKFLTPRRIIIFCELERSGNPKSEFHNVAGSFQSNDRNMKIAVTYNEKIKI
jgi:hypothetical protein